MSIQNLHDPSTASPAPTAAPSTPAEPPSVESEAHRLTAMKDALTTRLDVYYSVLRTNEVTMATPLVDPQGFPRSDIDVAGIRTARHQINRLRNDLKACMNDMSLLLERGLPRVEGGQREEMEVEEEKVEMEGFARVDAVAPGSPADLAGLKREDRIVSLGSVNASNHEELQGVAQLVGKSEGVTLALVVLRPSSVEGSEPTLNRLHLRLTPGAWKGRGLLGCHIVPL